MSQNIPLAIALGIVGSFCFALSAKVQHGVVDTQQGGNRAKERMDSSAFFDLLRQKKWWMGLGLMGVSLVCQVLGLTMAPVSVVQPVGLLAFPWSVLLAARTRDSRFPLILLAVGLTVTATLGFTWIVARNTSSAEELELVPVAIAAGIVYAIAGIMALLGSRGPLPWRCLFWASGGALFYGLEAALVKSLIEFARTHEWWRDPMVYAIGVALLAGSALAGLLIQQGYATGPAEVVVGSMTVTSPVIAVLFGILVLGEGQRINQIAGLGMILLGATAVAGVVALARFHPDYDATLQHMTLAEELEAAARGAGQVNRPDGVS